MPIDTAKIWQLLKLLGVADESKCRELAAQAAVDLGPEALSDCLQLSKFLADKNLLTTFQLSAIQNDDLNQIFTGEFAISNDSAPTPFDGWKTAVREEKQYWIHESDLAAALRSTDSRSLPNLERLSRIEAISCNELIRFESSTNAEKLILAVPALSGSLLKKALPQKPLSRKQSLNIFLPIVRAASALHESNVVHGCIGIDKVWCKSETEFQLLVDPIYETFANSGDDSKHSIRCCLSLNDINSTVAPELTVAGQKATSETDIYALAVLLWRLATGHMPFDDVTPAQRAVAHATQILDFSPFAKWPKHETLALKRALAKNPSERFPSAQDFENELLGNNRSQQTTNSAAKQKAAKLAPAASNLTRTSNTTKEPLTKKREPVSNSNAQQHTPQTAEQTLASKPKKKIDARLLTNPGGSSPPATSRRKRKRSKPKWVMPTLVVGGLLAICGLIVGLTFLTQDTNTSDNSISANQLNTPSVADSSATATQPATSSLPSSDEYRVIEDDGSTLWLPPHESDPIDVSALPAGAQAILSFSPEFLSTLDSSDAIFASLDINSQEFISAQQKSIGVSNSKIERITIAMYPGIDGWPQSATRVNLKSPSSIADLQSTWGNADRQLTPSQSVLFVVDELAYFVPPEQLQNDAIQSFTIAQIDAAIELADSDVQEFELRRQLEELRETTSQDNAVTFLFAPSFLTADGRQLIEFYAPNFRDELSTLLDPTLPAGVLSIANQTDCFVELRILGTGQQNTAKLLTKLRGIFDNLADSAERSLIDQPPPNFWRSIGIRLPGMLRTTANYQRFGIENGQAVTNLRLPPTATANLAAGAWLMARQWADSAQSIPPSATAKTLSIEEILNQTVTLSFGQQSLETTLQLLVEERNDSLPAGAQKLKFTIDGSAFESEGITRNKEIEPMDFRNAPFRDTLTELAMRANSSRVDDPKSSDQKVVWRLISDGQITIELTTKKALDADGIAPPAEFIPR